MKNSKLLYIIVTVISFILIGCNKNTSVSNAQFVAGSGDYVVRITFADYGQITFRIFKDAAPEAVEQFVSEASSGYYNGTRVNTVIEDYCFIMNSLSANESTMYDMADSDADKYLPYRGSICFSDISNGINAGSIMVINSDSDFLKELSELLEYKQVTLAEYLKQAYGVTLDDKEIASYMSYGGAPWLYGHTVVFGQVYDGFDVLDKLNLVMTSEDGLYIPTEEIIIESIEIIQQ